MLKETSPVCVFRLWSTKLENEGRAAFPDVTSDSNGVSFLNIYIFWTVVLHDHPLYLDKTGVGGNQVVNKARVVTGNEMKCEVTSYLKVCHLS